MILKMKPSKLAEDFFYLTPAEPLGFDDFPFFRAIYNSPSRVKLLKCSRQVGKSVTIVCLPSSGIAVAEAQLRWVRLNNIPKARLKALNIRPKAVLTVTPVLPQARKLSEQKLTPILNSSPIFDDFRNNKTADLVMSKTFIGGSSYSLGACFRSADSIRGQTNDWVNIDEIQDVDLRFIPVIFETQTRSKDPGRILSGTAKTTSNTIEHYWKQSKQIEWIVKCISCNHQNVLGEKNIGLLGPICSRCGKRIYPIQTGQWVAMNRGGAFDGFRINALMAEFFPWTAERGSEMWPFTFMYKYETYPKAKFHNEVLALPFDSGKKPVTEAEIKMCCDPGVRKSLSLHPGMEPSGSNVHQRAMISAGVDWGTSLEGNAKTVLTMVSYLNGKFAVIFAKKYGVMESDPEHQVNDIIKWCKEYNVASIGVDEGFGHMKNELLAKAMGVDFKRGNSSRVIKFSNSGNVKDRSSWNAKGNFYSINRTEIMSDLFLAIKMKRICFPEWSVFGEFAKDILAVDIEYNEALQKMYYTHSPTEPDDFTFALIYALENLILNLGMDKLR